jgi:hypothetical protein
METPRLCGAIRRLRSLTSFQRNVIKSWKDIIRILQASAFQENTSLKSKIQNALVPTADPPVKPLQKRVEDADQKTAKDPRANDTPKTEIQIFKDSIQGIFEMTRTVLPLISDIKEAAKSIAPKPEGIDKSLDELQGNIAAITTAMESMRILYGPAAPKIPAACPGVLSVGGLSTKYTICKEFYYGDGTVFPCIDLISQR